MALTGVHGITQSARVWVEQKAEERRMHCLPELGRPHSALRHRHTWLSGLLTQAGTTASLPGPSACKWQLVGLLSLQNHVSQSLAINFFLCLLLCVLLFLLLSVPMHGASRRRFR